MFRFEWTEFPPELAQNVDVAESFQRDVGGALLVGMRKIADQAATNTPYPDIAAGFEVESSASGRTVEASIGNRNSTFPYVEEDTRPHFPPFDEGSPLAAWADARGIPPFLVARAISETGTQGKHMLAEAFQDGQDAVIGDIEAAIARWLERWGTR
jgi:hypothetical protein